MCKVTRCTKCYWQFKTHKMARQCPSCGSYKVEPTDADKPEQSEWLERRHQQDRERAIEEAEKDKCCYTAEHTHGWHHDSYCKNWVTGF